jgi:hypothetical protein
MRRLQDDFLLSGLWIVVRRRRTPQTDEDRAVRMHLHVLGASLDRGANGTGDIGLRDHSGTARHGALSVAVGAF